MDFISLSELQALLNVIIVDLVLAGLVLWVWGRLWRDLRTSPLVRLVGTSPRDVQADRDPVAVASPKTMRQAVPQIIVADA